MLVTILLRLCQLRIYVLEFPHLTQPAFTCSKLTIEIVEQNVEYVQS